MNSVQTNEQYYFEENISVENANHETAIGDPIEPNSTPTKDSASSSLILQTPASK